MKTRGSALGFLALAFLCLALPINALADIDSSVFKDEGFTIKQDDMTDDGSIMYNVYSCYQTYMPTNNGLVISAPAIFISDGSASLSIAFNYTASDWCFIKDIIVKAGDNRYNFPDVASDTDVEDGGISEWVVISFGEKSYPLLQYISDNQSAEIKVRLDGSESDEDFVLDPVVKQAIKKLYDAFVLGGGITQSANDLEALEGIASAVTVK